ncbi:uncharacterized protein WCI35_002363, partial [Daubentonia madagascariensis]
CGQPLCSSGSPPCPGLRAKWRLVIHVSNKMWNKLVKKNTSVEIGDNKTFEKITTVATSVTLTKGTSIANLKPTEIITEGTIRTTAYESYKKKDYTQVDYLINGMYADSEM